MTQHLLFKNCPYFGSFCGPYFPMIHRINLRIQYKCGKIRTRETQNTDTFHATPNLSATNIPRIDIPELQVHATKIISSCENNHLKANPGKSHILLRDNKDVYFRQDSHLLIYLFL